MSKAETLLGKLAGKLDDALEEHSEEWLAKGVNEARRLSVAELDEDEDELVQDGLDVVEDHLGPLARLGRGRALALLHYVGLGRKDEARELWLRTTATFEERRVASAQSTAGAHERARQNATDLESLLEAAEKLGAMAIRAALPLLMGAL